MIVRWPGGRAGRRQRGCTTTSTSARRWPTCSARSRAGAGTARSYAAALSSGEDCGREYLVLSQCAHVCQRSVRFGDWLYMRTYHDGYHLFPDEMLYDVARDPHEERNVIDAHADVAGEAARTLDRWRAEMMRTSASNVDPMWTVLREGGPEHARGHLAGYVKFLEKTGRGWAVRGAQKTAPRGVQVT